MVRFFKAFVHGLAAFSAFFVSGVAAQPAAPPPPVAAPPAAVAPPARLQAPADPPAAVPGDVPVPDLQR
jgi:hypothetical protein